MKLLHVQYGPYFYSKREESVSSAFGIDCMGLKNVNFKYTPAWLRPRGMKQTFPFSPAGALICLMALFFQIKFWKLWHPSWCTAGNCCRVKKSFSCSILLVSFWDNRFISGYRNTELFKVRFLYNVLVWPSQSSSQDQKKRGLKTWKCYDISKCQQELTRNGQRLD